MFIPYWKSRSNPHHCGEGLPIKTPSEAQRIVEQHNINYPKFKHWYEAAPSGCADTEGGS